MIIADYIDFSDYGPIVIGIIVGVIVLAIIVSCIKVVPQAQARILERLGAYRQTWSVGIHFKIPFIVKLPQVK